MNLILFEPEEVKADMTVQLAAGDIRTVHLRKILKAEPGTGFEAGIIDGMKGRAVINEFREGAAVLSFEPGSESPELHPLTLILGLSRPPTVKKVLKEATALGVRRFILCGTENGERSYIESSALKHENIRKILIEGAQQAVCTRLPEVRIEHSLRCALESIEGEYQSQNLIALDNVEASLSLSDLWSESSSHGNNDIPAETVLAVGSERGWTARERDRLKKAGFSLCSLGERVLRTETASIAGSAICLSGMGLL